MFGSAESEHPRLTDGEIISEEFQSVCVHNPLVNVAEGRTDGRTDRQTCGRKTALCSKVHRAVKTVLLSFALALRVKSLCPLDLTEIKTVNFPWHLILSHRRRHTTDDKVTQHCSISVTVSTVG